MSTIKFDEWRNTDNSLNGRIRAWAAFNGTGVVALLVGANVSSITDVGTGQYRLNFATAMPTANYGVLMQTVQAGGTGVDKNIGFSTRLTTSVLVRTAIGGVDTDFSDLTVAVLL